MVLIACVSMSSGMALAWRCPRKKSNSVHRWLICTMANIPHTYIFYRTAVLATFLKILHATNRIIWKVVCCICCLSCHREIHLRCILWCPHGQRSRTYEQCIHNLHLHDEKPISSLIRYHKIQQVMSLELSTSSGKTPHHNSAAANTTHTCNRGYTCPPLHFQAGLRSIALPPPCHSYLGSHGDSYGMGPTLHLFLPCCVARRAPTPASRRRTPITQASPRYMMYVVLVCLTWPHARVQHVLASGRHPRHAPARTDTKKYVYLV